MLRKKNCRDKGWSKHNYLDVITFKYKGNQKEWIGWDVVMVP